MGDRLVTFDGSGAMRMTSIGLSGQRIATVTLDVLSIGEPNTGFYIESLRSNKTLPEATPDRTPPAITVTLPGDFIRSWALVESGPVEVDYSEGVAAYYRVDGQLEIHCNPPPGSLFSIGKSLVTCEASDLSGNVGVSSFYVGVGECRVSRSN